jgi:hypothetical protein
VSGNTASATEKVTGVLGAILQFFASVLAAIWGAIVAAAEMVVAAVSWLIDWILSVISSMLDTVIRPILDGVDALARWMADSLLSAYQDGSRDPLSDLSENSVLQFIIGLLTAIDIAMLFVTVFLNVFSVLLSLAINVVMEAMVSALGGGLSQSGESGLTATSPDDAEGIIDGIMAVFGINLGADKFKDIKGGIEKAWKWFKDKFKRIQKVLGYSPGFVKISAILFVANIVSRVIGWTLEAMDVEGPSFAFASLIIVALSTYTLLLYIFKTKPIPGVWWGWPLKIALSAWTTQYIINFGHALVTGELAWSFFGGGG